MICGKCNSSVPDSAYCIRCGAAQVRAYKRPKRYIVWIASLVFLFIAAMIVLLIATSNDKYDYGEYNNEKSEFNNAYFTYQIDIGMSEYQVKEAWGEPYDIQTTTTEYGTSKMYTYIDFKGDYYFVHFDDGKVSAVSEY